ncbi:unnamed protein product [Mytilus edulis]|uniref:MACPF domain-containing protein n=1 Tax=Mytilus edulis TaxID=6550 RepID=A0A8S3TUX2_MYTED|nr:unnamed protein product [Mytilus edulis]
MTLTAHIATVSEVTSCQTKSLIGFKQYDIPDQVWSIINIPNGLLSSKTEIQKTSHGVKQSMGIKVDVGYGEGIFSSSGSYKTMQNYITNSSRFIEDVTSYTSGYKIILKPYWALEFGQIAQMYIDKRLPKTLNESTCLQYMEFIKSFGTHIFNHGKFGGLLRLVLATDESYYLDKTDSGGGSSGTQRVDEAFTRATRKDVRYYGGTTNLIDTKGITAWQPTVERNPWLFGGSLTEISGMIADISKQQSMKRAVQIYMDKAYLKELLRIVARYYTSREWDQHRHVLMNYNKQVNSMLQHNLPDHNAIVTLAKTIENATVIPGWFRGSRICYNWYADGDNGQCSEHGEQTGLLCANVNQWTGYYRDDTDRGNGGCLMRWGIMSSGYDDWFKNVRMCYKWGSESADGGQCGSGTSGVTCANVNSYTDYYKDDTDRRAGGCYMQWMLSVPTSSPLWIQNAEICYQWDSDVDNEQCGRVYQNFVRKGKHIH